MARVTPKVAEAADAVRGMIAAGRLLPGEPAPTAPRLSAQTGVCYVYCLRALRVLVDDGTLEAGKPPRGRPRVTGLLRERYVQSRVAHVSCGNQLLPGTSGPACE